MDQITNYSTLQLAVAGMLHRTGDASLTANLPLFIQMCEADLNDRLLLKDMESDEALTLVQDANYIALPTGFVSPIACWIIVDNERIELDPLLAQQLPYYHTAGRPSFYAVDAGNLRFDCPADAAYSGFLRCIKKSNLSESVTSNALLLKRPDVYLFGTLKQVALFIADDNDAQKWSAMYESAIKGLKDANHRNKSIVPLRTDYPNNSVRGSILTGD